MVKRWSLPPSAAASGGARKKTKTYKTSATKRGQARRKYNIMKEVNEMMQEEVKSCKPSTSAAVVASAVAPARPASLSAAPAVKEVKKQDKSVPPEVLRNKENAKVQAAKCEADAQLAHRKQVQVTVQDPVYLAQVRAQQDFANKRMNGLMNFITNFLPPATEQWLFDNRVSQQDGPANLDELFHKDCKLVLSYKLVSGLAVLGATLLRRDKRKKHFPWEQRAQLVLHIHPPTGKIVHRWTDWMPNSKRNRPGIFVWLFRDLIVPFQAGQKQFSVGVFDGVTALNKPNLQHLVDHRYTHLLFASDAAFPPESMWKIG